MAINNRRLPANFDLVTQPTIFKGDGEKRKRDLESHNSTVLEDLTLGPLAAIVGGIDTFLTSVTPDSMIDDTDVEETVTNLYKPLGDYYREHKDGAQIVGDLALAFVPIVGASKLIRSAGYVDKLLQKTEKGAFLSKFIISSGKTRKDIINDLDAVEKAFGKSKAVSTSETGITSLSKAQKGAQITAATDMLKEGTAANIAILATMNSSDIMFPDDISAATNFALFAIPDLALAGLAYRFTGTAIRKHLQSLGPEFAKMVNVHGLDTTSVVQFEGTRGPALAVHSAEVRQAENDFKSSESGKELLTASKQRMDASRVDVFEDTVNLFKDDFFKHGVSKNENLKPGSPQVQSFAAASIKEPSLGAGIQDLGVLLEKSNVNNQRAWDARVASLDKKASEIDELISARAAELADKIKVGPVKDKELVDLYKQADIVAIEKDKFQKAPLAVVLETDHSIVPLNQRRWSPFDDRQKFKASFESVTDGGVQIRKLKESVAIKLDMELGVTRQGKLLVSSSGKASDAGAVLGGIKTEAALHKMPAASKAVTKPTELAAGDQIKNSLSNLTVDQHMTVWGALQLELAKFDVKKDSAVFLHPQSTYQEEDFAYQLLKKFPSNPELVKKNVGTASENYDIDELAFSILGKKFEMFQQIEASQNGLKTGLLKVKDSTLLSEFTKASLLNMPNPGLTGIDPLIALFKEYAAPLGGEMRRLDSFFKDMGEIKIALGKNAKESKLGEELAELSITGSVLRHDFNPEFAPVVMRGRDNYSGRLSPDELNMRVAQNREWQNNLVKKLLSDPEAKGKASIVAGMIEVLLRNPKMLEKARRPDEIVEGTATNLGLFGQQTETFAHVPPIKAADTLSDLQTKEILPIVNAIMRGKDDEFTLIFNKLNSNGNAASLDTLNIAVNSFRHGWVLKRDTVKLGKDLNGFELDLNSQFNHEMYEKLFGKNLADVAKAGEPVLMPVRASAIKGSKLLPKSVAVDSLALEGLTALTSISHTFLDNLNFDRALRHMKPINKKEWHIPAVNLGSGTSVYITNGRGAVDEIISRPTLAEAQRVADKIVGDRIDAGERWAVQSEDQVMQYHDSLSDIWQNARNFSFSELQTGSAKGKLGNAEIQFGRGQLDEILTSLTTNFQLLVRHTNATLFEGELNFARTHIRANSLIEASAKKSKSTLFQQYERTLLGRSALNEHGLIGKMYYATESVVDDMLRSQWDKLQTFKSTTPRASDAEFARLNDKLGDFNPFKSIEEMLDNSKEVSTPPTMRAAVTKLNGFTTNMVLRILDMGMPVINFASLVSVMPSVVAALRRGADESYDAWISRIGAFGTPISDTQALPSTGRMLQTGLSLMFSKEMKGIRDTARNRGLIKQEVAERLNLWTSSHQGWVARNRDNVIDKLSFMTDKSEELSRDWAFAMMVSIGKKMLKLPDESAITFAHGHANKVIGDFRPTNRPQMFQGAAGMPLGLFTTWAVNWLQRVFGDIEAGRLGASFYQFAAQQMLFGTQSFPGVETIMNTWLTDYDGKGTIEDKLDNAFGRTATDMLLHGTMSTATGIAFQTRAGVSFPNIFTGESITQAVPSFSVMTTLYTGLAEAFKSVQQNGGWDSAEMSEIMSLYSVNGFLRNTFEMIQGFSVDRQRQMINDSVRDFESVLPRIFELKSQREVRKAQLMQRDKMQRHIERTHIEKLSKQLRAASRGGTIDAELIESALNDYWLAGGDPSDFKRYLREQVILATTEKSSRRLLQALRASDERGLSMALHRVTFDDM